MHARLFIYMQAKPLMLTSLRWIHSFIQVVDSVMVDPKPIKVQGGSIHLRWGASLLQGTMRTHIHK